MSLRFNWVFLEGDACRNCRPPFPTALGGNGQTSSRKDRKIKQKPKGPSEWETGGILLVIVISNSQSWNTNGGVYLWRADMCMCISIIFLPHSGYEIDGLALALRHTPHEGKGSAITYRTRIYVGYNKTRKSKIRYTERLPALVEF